jgi:hypothetical protein
MKGAVLRRKTCKAHFAANVKNITPGTGNLHLWSVERNINNKLIAINSTESA